MPAGEWNEYVSNLLLKIEEFEGQRLNDLEEHQRPTRPKH